MNSIEFLSTQSRFSITVSTSKKERTRRITMRRIVARSAGLFIETRSTATRVPKIREINSRRVVVITSITSNY